MAKIVYNSCYGGFGLSHDAIMRYAELKGFKLYAFVDGRTPDGRIDLRSQRPASDEEARTAFCTHYCTTPDYSNDSYWSGRDMPRHDPALVQVVEELRDRANGKCAKLKIEELPDGTLYRIDEYDGSESVMTNSDYQWTVAA